MSGTPTEAEIQSQWTKAVDVLESLRNFADGTLAVAGGKFDVLEQALEGDYTPAELSTWVNTIRGGLSDLLTPNVASAMLTPILREYAGILAADATGGYGSGFRSMGELKRALYEWFVANSLTVESRAITYDTSATAGAGNVGNGAMSRLTVDENGFNLEACHVEKKTFRCRADQNSGTEENAEVFEFVGEAASFDALLRASFGSGESARTTLVSRHAGSGNGGSLLTNASFSEFTSTNSPKFTGWTETAVPASSIDQDTVNYYRAHPGSQTSAALEITGGLGTVTLTQSLANMRVRRLDADRPYVLRVMVNKTVGTASGGTFTIRMGSVEVDTAIASIGSGWQEILVPLDATCWFRSFNQDPFTVEIEWASSTSGTLLVDDVIFAPLDLIDGTYWFLRGKATTHTPWLVDDTLTFTDTGGAPATGKVQWWLWVAGFGYLPSSGTPTFADP